MKQLNRIIFVLSLIGVLMATYVLQSWLRHSTIVCLTGGCTTVAKSPAAWPFGIPVPAVGLVGYTILTICAFLRTANYKQQTMNMLLRIMLGMAAFGVCFVTWFTLTELFVIHGICMWCAISAVDMVVIFALVTKSYTLSK